jgi:hypothetical protein
LPHSIPHLRKTGAEAEQAKTPTSAPRTRAPIGSVPNVAAPW